MIGFELNEEQRMFQKTAHDFAERELRPLALKCDHEHSFPQELIKKGHEAGLIAYHYPEEYGGGGVKDFVSCAVIREELAWGCPGLTIAMLASNLAATPILHMGTHEQKKKYITRLCDPDNIAVAAMGMTEPDAGSDVAGIRTIAEKKGGRYVLNGRKTFITNGGIADVTVVYARVAGSKGMEGMTAFIIDGKPKGFSMGKVEDKMGILASHTSELLMEDVEVPEDDRLGPEGEAFKMSMHMFEESRINVAAMAVGIARAALEIALDYAKERKQFGQSIIKFEGISFKLADMAMQIDAARLLTWRAAWLANQGKKFNRESAMAKCFASEAASMVTDNAIQILGGYGYMHEYMVEKLHRDARVFRIFEGTSEIMRLIVARELGRE
jgi:acyl-CoA dehydrogenase